MSLCRPKKCKKCGLFERSCKPRKKCFDSDSDSDSSCDYKRSSGWNDENESMWGSKKIHKSKTRSHDSSHTKHKIVYVPVDDVTTKHEPTIPNQSKIDSITEANEVVCKICMTNKIDCAIKSCGHTLCMNCVNTLKSQTKNECPFCRQKVDFTQDVLKLFYS